MQPEPPLKISDAKLPAPDHFGLPGLPCGARAVGRGALQKAAGILWFPQESEDSRRRVRA